MTANKRNISSSLTVFYKIIFHGLWLAMGLGVAAIAVTGKGEAWPHAALALMDSRFGRVVGFIPEQRQLLGGLHPVVVDPA